MKLAAAFYLGSIAACVLAALGALAWLPSAGRGHRRLAGAAGWLALAAVLAAWAARFRVAGHLPLFGTYESALSLALAVLAAALLWRRAVRVPLVPVAAAVAAALLAHGLGYDDTPYALTISERSWVVDVHAVLAWAAFGVLTVNAGFALCRALRRQEAAGVERGLTLSLSVGFLLHTAMMASGSYYKFLLFGRAWSFDPIESLGFIAWIAYGTLLHLHLLAGWEGRRLARWCVGLFVLLVVSYRAIVYFPAASTYHIFDMDLRIHVTGSQPPTLGGTE